MTEPTVVTAGAGMFADAVAGQAVAVERVDWRPPMPGTEADLAAVATDPRRPAANRQAVEAMLGVTAHLVDVAPASEVLGLEPGQFLHAGPPIEWDRASGPLRGALMGGAALEGLVDDPEDAVALFESGSSVSLEPCHHRSAVGPMAGVVTPSMWMWVLEDRATGAPDVLLAQRGPRQGAALRRLRPRGAHPAALDGRRARAAPPGRRARHRRRPTDVTGILTQMLQMGDEAHNRNRAGTLMLLRDLAPAMVGSGFDAADVAEVLRFVGGNDHFFLNLAMPGLQARSRRGARRPRLDDGRGDGAQRHRLRHPGLRHGRRVVHRSRPGRRGPLPRRLRPRRRQPRHRRLRDHRDGRHRRLRDGHRPGDRPARRRLGARRACHHPPDARDHPRGEPALDGARAGVPGHSHRHRRDARCAAPGSCRRSTPAWPGGSPASARSAPGSSPRPRRSSRRRSPRWRPAVRCRTAARCRPRPAPGRVRLGDRGHDAVGELAPGAAGGDAVVLPRDV